MVGGLQPEPRPAEASGVPRLDSRQTLTSLRRSQIPQAATGDAQMTGFVSQVLALLGMMASRGAPWKPSVAAGVRTTAAVMVPLVIGQLAGNTALAMIVGIGGLNVSLADIGGPYRMKAITMRVATISLAAAAYLGTVVGQWLWLSSPFMFLLASAAGLAGLYGNAAAKVSFLTLILFVLMAGMPAGTADGAERCVALVGGRV